MRERILDYSARTLDRITQPHRATSEPRWKGRKTGRASNRIKKFVPIRCGPQEFDEPGWIEADTVSHGGGSSSGAFLWSLTLTDFHHDRGTDKLLKIPLPFGLIGVDWGCEAFSMVGSLEGFVGETCGLPLRVACGGSAICLWRCGAGTVSHLSADV